MGSFAQVGSFCHLLKGARKRCNSFKNIIIYLLPETNMEWGARFYFKKVSWTSNILKLYDSKIKNKRYFSKIYQNIYNKIKLWQHYNPPSCYCQNELINRYIVTLRWLSKVFTFTRPYTKLQCCLSSCMWAVLNYLIYRRQLFPRKPNYRYLCVNVEHNCNIYNAS